MCLVFILCMLCKTYTWMLDFDCRNLNNEELKETYKIESSSLRERLMHAIVQATREEMDTDNEVNIYTCISLTF